MSELDELKQRQLDLLSAPYRQPTPDERALLALLLQRGSEVANQFLVQLESIQVRRSCACGCPSIALKPDESVPRLQPPSRIIVDDFFGETPAGNLVGIIVFTNDGHLSELEFYDVKGEIVGSWPLPTLGSIAYQQPHKRLQ